MVAAIEFAGLRKSYGSREVLHGIDLSVEDLVEHGARLVNGEVALGHQRFEDSGRAAEPREDLRVAQTHESPPLGDGLAPVQSAAVPW